MRVKVLGCSGGVGAGLHTTALLLDEDILIDAGTGVGTLSLAEMGKIRHVFVTHSHLDHIAGIPLMIDSIFDRLDTPLTVHARPETIEALRTHVFNNVIWPDFSRLPHPDHPVMQYAEMRPGETMQLGARTIEMIEVNHIVPACGYRVENGTGAFAFSGDTTQTDTFWDVLNAKQALDLLIVESAFPNEEFELSQKARHYCPQVLAQDLARLRHRPRVFLTHLKPGMEDQIVGECRRDIHGLRIERLFGGEVFQL